MCTQVNERLVVLEDSHAAASAGQRVTCFFFVGPLMGGQYHPSGWEGGHDGQPPHGQPTHFVCAARPTWAGPVGVRPLCCFGPRTKALGTLGRCCRLARCAGQHCPRPLSLCCCSTRGSTQHGSPWQRGPHQGSLLSGEAACCVCGVLLPGAADGPPREHHEGRLEQQKCSPAEQQ